LPTTWSVFATNDGGKDKSQTPNQVLPIPWPLRPAALHKLPYTMLAVLDIVVIFIVAQIKERWLPRINAHQFCMPVLVSENKPILGTRV